MPVANPLLRSAWGILSCAGLALAGASCASSRLEWSEPEFGRAALRGENVTVAGVIDRCGRLSGREAGALSSTVALQLRKRGKDVAVQRSGGSQGQRLSRNANVAAVARENLRKGKARYVLVMELLENGTSRDVDHSCEEITEAVYDKEGKQVGCRVVRIDYTTRSIAYRHAEIRCHLWERGRSDAVWVVTARHRESRSRSRIAHCDYPPPPPFPDPPALADLADNLGRASLRKLRR